MTPLNELSLDPDKESALPFDIDKQKAFLGHVMDYSSSRFFMTVKDQVKAEWFSDPWCAKLYDGYRKFYGYKDGDKVFPGYDRIPQSPEEFLRSTLFKSMPQNEKNRLETVETECRLKRQRFGSDVLASELTDWMRCRIFHQSVSKSARHFNQGELGLAVGILEETVRAYQLVRFDGAPAADWSDPRALVLAQEIDTKGAMTTGLPLLDKKLLDLGPSWVGPSGALLPGDTTLLISPVNTGKTTALLTIARHNIRERGKSVLLVTLEGRELDIQEKIWCAMMNRTRVEFRRIALSTDEMDIRALEAYRRLLAENLTYISMNRPDTTVEEVVSAIRVHQNHRIANTGKGYDLLVVDYPGILISEHAQKWEFRQMMDRVYRSFVQLGLEEKFHVLVAAQTNREGSKVNRGGGEESRLLTLEDIAESFAITHSATNVITVNRGDSAKAKNRMTYYVCKSRSGETGWAVACESFFDKALAHKPDGRSTVYRGSDSQAARIDMALTTYNGREFTQKGATGLTAVE